MAANEVKQAREDELTLLDGVLGVRERVRDSMRMFLNFGLDQ